MAKNIKLTEEMKNSTIASIIAKIRNARLIDEVKSYNVEQEDIHKRATLRFTETAWLKMQALVQTFDGEVGWRGLVRKTDEEYVVYDLVVYPQTVSAAYIDTDQKEHSDWFEKLPDEIITNMKLHGHSHVRMGVTPSGRDRSDYQIVIDDLRDDSFYVFLIINKMNDMFVQIYDMHENVIYEKNDIDIVVDSEVGIVQFIKDAKDVVKNRTEVKNKNGSKQTMTTDKLYEADAEYTSLWW